MSYKTPNQLLDVIINEHLLTDACMTIIDGRNEYGFHAVKVPNNAINKLSNTAWQVLFNDGEYDNTLPVTVPDDDKDKSLWLISFKKNKYSIIVIEHEKGLNIPRPELEKKEYMSVILLFLDNYKITSKKKLYEILKYGYAELKEEINQENAYQLLRDYMDDSMVVLHTEELPKKFGIRFRFPVIL